MKQVKDLEEILEKTSGKDKFKILNQLSEVYEKISPQKSIDFALETLDHLQHLKGSQKKAEVYIRLGDLYKQVNEYDRAMSYYQTALELSKSAKNDKKRAEFLNSIGEVSFRLTNYDQALEYYLKSLKIREEIHDKKGIADSLNTVGNIYFQLKNYSQALDYYQHSLKIRLELQDEIAIAKSYNNLGNMYSMIKDYQKALDYYYDAIKLYDKGGEEKLRSSVYNNIGIIYREKGDLKKAEESFGIALKISKELGLVYNHANTSNEAARTYLEMKKYEEAEKHLNSALSEAKKLNARNVVQESYQIFSELYYAKKDFKNAYEYSKQFADLKDSIYGELSGKIAEIQSKYIAEQKEKEAEIYRLKNVEMAKYIKDLQKANDIIKKKNKELTDAYMKLDLLARTDPLTRLSNRRDILDKIKYEALKFERSGEKFVIVISDIDNFKTFNDSYGHDCGDFVLVNLANLMRSVLRKQDCIGRWGGEEFIFLMPKTDFEGGTMVAEKIRKKIESETFYYRDIKLNITMTFGVNVYDSIIDIDYCINKADEALYHGKYKGKNCVVRSDEIS
ncbi:MAG TPA: diguanylate cyclase [Clostridiales bacterium]|nr:diguanylate cyclase [Clostridiales bacterium]HQP70211.1 diguanylate cyclase [Clostridiales bacterium]